MPSRRPLIPSRATLDRRREETEPFLYDFAAVDSAIESDGRWPSGIWGGPEVEDREADRLMVDLEEEETELEREVRRWSCDGWGLLLLTLLLLLLW